MAVFDEPSAQAERDMQQVRAQLLEALTLSQFDAMYCTVECKPLERNTEAELPEPNSSMH